MAIEPLPFGRVGARTAVRRQLDRELDLVASAVAMVDAGLARRVTVSSLRFGAHLLDASRRMTVGKPVRVFPLYGTDESRCSISVERVHGEH